MSDPFAREEAWLRGALRAEEDALPVRLRSDDLGRLWGERRRRQVVRRLALVAAVVAVAAVGLGASWSLGPWGRSPQAQPPLSSPSSMVAGPVTVTETPATGPGLSAGRATLTLDEPKSAPSSFAVGCIWSVSGHMVGMTVGKQDVGGESMFVRWKPMPGPDYRIELVAPDQSAFTGLGIGSAAHAAADGGSGTITFANLTLNSGDPSTAPTRSGTFAWTCEKPARLGSAAPSLPAPVVDEQGFPSLWILHNGNPVRRTLTGCPAEMTTLAGGVESSCATGDWWQPLESLNASLEVSPGDALAFALDGWTVTSAAIVAMPVASAGPNTPVVGLHATLGNGAVAFAAPGAGDWFARFTIEAARDDGSTLDASYAYPISVR